MTSENENENRKTIADVLAKMERESIIHVYIPATDLERYVKQIKEALKREKAEIEADALAVGGIVEAARTAEKSSAVGNSAAMRETMSLFVHDFASFMKDVEHGIFHMMQCMDFVKKFIPLMDSALSEPARNCDLYDNKTDAETRFVEETGENDMAQHYWQMFAIWLFDTAARQKVEVK